MFQCVAKSPKMSSLDFCCRYQDDPWAYAVCETDLQGKDMSHL